MRDNQKNSGHSTWLSVILTVGTLVLAVGILHWAREVLVPIALAILLSFILSPIVSQLQRRGLGQKLSVALTVMLAFVLIGGVGLLILSEFRGLANELPAYQQNIRKKIADLHVAVKTGSLGKVHQTVQEVIKELKKEDPVEAKSAAPIPVVVKDAGNTVDLAFLKSLFGPAVMAGLVIVLVVFMLLRRDDLRDRLLQMAGYGRLAVTTKAIDEAGKQVSRYLLRQFLVNTSFGVIAGAGFGMIGLPYAVLWGFFAGVARFVPYLGFVLGLAGPLLMSLAVFDGWTVLLMVIGLFVCLELLAGMLIEPLIYGKGIGVSEVALLVMIAFWTWLWGAVGLLLATPLTVCLMVISKSVPNLKFISVLLNHEPALDVHRIFYHRLIARDEAEVRNIVKKFLSEHPESELFEHLLIPTLASCRHDFQRHKLTEEDRQFIFKTIRQIIGEEEAPSSHLASGNDGLKLINGEIAESLPSEKPWLVGFPAHDEADELALLMLAKLLGQEHWRMRVLSAGILSAEALVEAERNRPAVFCIGFLAPGATFPARQLCKRLHSRFPDQPVILGRWGTPDREQTRERFADLVTEFGWSLAETRNLLIQYGQMEKSFNPQARDAWLETEGMPPPKGGWAGSEKINIKFIEQKL